MRIAIVGATGLVGREVLKILNERGLITNHEIFLFASRNSAGKTIKVGEAEFVVSELTKSGVPKCDFAIFCAGRKIAEQYAQIFIKKGAVVVDNSSAFRRHKSVPLVIPEVNVDAVGNSRLIANPNCSTIGVSVPLFYLSSLSKIKRVIVSTYQAVSGAGQNGVMDLECGTNRKIVQGIKNNIVPQIDYALLNGYTFEEDKMRFELKKILNDRYLKVSATCVRVPVFNCHCASINIEFENEPNMRDVRLVLKNGKGISVVDDLKNNMVPMPLIANGKDNIFVGRIRRDISNPRAINLFVCFDNVRKGAALNAVQIIQAIINESKLR